ncbi:hypothetical protein [Streptacidiphilus sp. EB103A]|uniref:hypothetical protein n=1 Tax=Streptacidiphilus sp. EB103A TaxID=3156275 RepID=UPI003515DD2B
MTDDVTRTYVRDALEALQKTTTDRADYLRRIEAEGHRIINIDASGDPEQLCPWQITDWRTGEVLASGDSSTIDWEAALKSLDPDGIWRSLDDISDSMYEDVEAQYAVNPQIPYSLSEVLDEWVRAGGTDEEVAQWSGWSVEAVQRARLDERHTPQD